MTQFFDFSHTVTDDEIDAQGHVHNLRYLQWTLAAASAHTKACGWDAAEALEAGFGWVVRSHEATYRAAALAADQVTVRTWVGDAEKFASRRKYVICRPRDRTVLARVETRWVYVDLSVRKVVPIPEDVRARLVICEESPGMPWE
jgi:acyl-CoA thioester hydrolase